MSWLKNAFAVKGEKPREYTEEECAVINKLAGKVHYYRMSVPAIIFLESSQPLNFVASQVMVFFKPFISAFFNTREYDLLQTMLEDRNTIEFLLKTIESYEENSLDGNKGSQDGSAKN